MADKSYQLVVRKGPDPGEVYALQMSYITIGRDPVSDIVLKDPEISRQHAQLVQTAEGYQIRDMGSTNGTFVNNERLGGEPVTLVPGQEIMLGSGVTVVYEEVPGAADAAESPTAGRFSPEAENSWPESPVPVGDEDEDDVAAIPEDPDEAMAWLEQRAAEEGVALDDMEPVDEWQAPAAEPQPLSAESGDEGADEAPPSLYEFSRAAETPPSEPASSYAAPQQPSFVPPADDRQDDSRRRVITAVVVVVLLLCCCCAFLLFMWFWGGDWLIEQFDITLHIVPWWLVA